MQFKIILFLLIIYHQYGHSENPDCPANCISCQPSRKGLKNINRNVELTAICTKLPQTLLADNIISIEIQANSLTLSHESLYWIQNVSSLDVSGCNLTFDEHAFVSMKNLTVLRLRNNKLHSLPHDMFVTLHYLRELYLDYNELKTFNNDLSSLTNLKILSLSHNRLSSFPENLPGSLTHLNVSYNRISPTIPENSSHTKMWFPLFSGETLDLYGNQIEYILSWSWINMTNIRFLRLGNKVTTLSSNTTEDSLNLKLFTLSARVCDNARLLDGVTKMMIKKMTRLTCLSLEYYMVDSLKFLQPMMELNTLIFYYIQTSDNLSINEGLAQLKKLKHLDLEGSSKLARLILDHIKELPIYNSLTFLGLKDTQLKELDMPVSFSSLHNNPYFRLDLRDNPLQCGVSLCWMFDLGMSPKNLVSPRNTTCIEVIQEKGQTKNVPKPLLTANREKYCFQTQFPETTLNPSDHQQQNPETTINQFDQKAPPRKEENSVNIVIIIIIFLLGMIVIVLLIIYIYFLKSKIHIFLPLNDENPPMRLQEIFQSEENLNQQYIK